MLSKIKKIFERVIYINCVLLAMSNNINVLDDTKHVIIADKPSIDVVRGLPSWSLEIALTKFSKLSFLIRVDSK